MWIHIDREIYKNVTILRLFQVSNLNENWENNRHTIENWKIVYQCQK